MSAFIRFERRAAGMKIPDGRTFAARTLSVMVVTALSFLVMYPLIYVILPERLARLADLPRDFSLALLFDGIVIPLVAAGLYVRMRRRAMSDPGVYRDREFREGGGSGGS